MARAKKKIDSGSLLGCPQCGDSGGGGEAGEIGRRVGDDGRERREPGDLRSRAVGGFPPCAASRPRPSFDPRSARTPLGRATPGPTARTTAASAALGVAASAPAYGSNKIAATPCTNPPRRPSRPSGARASIGSTTRRRAAPERAGRNRRDALCRELAVGRPRLRGIDSISVLATRDRFHGDRRAAAVFRLERTAQPTRLEEVDGGEDDRRLGGAAHDLRGRPPWSRSRDRAARRRTRRSRGRRAGGTEGPRARRPGTGRRRARRGAAGRRPRRIRPRSVPSRGPRGRGLRGPAARAAEAAPCHAACPRRRPPERGASQSQAPGCPAAPRTDDLRGAAEAAAAAAAAARGRPAHAASSPAASRRARLAAPEERRRALGRDDGAAEAQLEAGLDRPRYPADRDAARPQSASAVDAGRRSWRTPPSRARSRPPGAPRAPPRARRARASP